MNIFYFLDKFPKLSESFIINEIRQLEKKGHNIYIFALEDPCEEVRHSELTDLESKVAYSNEYNLSILEKLRYEIIRRSHHNISNKKYSKIIERKCIKYINEINVDIDLVHTHFAHWKRTPAVLISNYTNSKLALTTHAFDLYTDHTKEKLLQEADRIITISNHNKSFLEENYPNLGQIEMINLGIDTSKFKPEDKPQGKRILTVSRLVEKKGLDIALEAVSILASDFEKLEYRIIGSGKLEDRLKEKIHELDLEDTVTLLGNVTDESLIEEYDKSSWFLLPCKVTSDGDKDGIPVALMEAMAMRTVPITTNVSGIPEIVKDDENGFIVDPEKPDRISEKLRKGINNEAKKRKMASKAREKVKKRFNLTKQSNKLEKTLQKISRS